MSLSGKVALVTGAARGIGRAIATVLAEEGADVAVVDLDPAVADTRAAVEALGRRAAAEIFDVADPGQVATGVARIRTALGEVDILVNNAGIVNNISPLETMPVEAWEREIRVNLGGAFHMIRAVIGPMVERRWGRIVNISSVAAQGGAHFQSGYAASKSGLIGLTHSVTIEYARYGITCNAVLPGLIATETVERMPVEIRSAFERFTPARRLGQPREIAELVAFLASERAAFINGAEIRIDGGARLGMLPLGSRRELRELLGT
jgi:NAD(P)-dependent dehydrogenase (short-subunit alcohol dehydrogenase family)